MRYESTKKLFFGFILFLFLIFIDQFSKYIIRHTGGFYICNTNLAFGIKLSYFLFFALALIIILFLISVGNSKHKIINPVKGRGPNGTLRPKQALNSNDENSKHSFGYLNLENLNLFRISSLEFSIFAILILAGAISNIIDRLYFGCVIDFIDLRFWPVFNLADVYIAIGTFLIMLRLIKTKKID